jgi:hypothetical protein
MKCSFVVFLLLIGSARLAAQSGASYPDVQALRTALTKLAAEKPSGFQNIKGTFRYKHNTVAYYNSSVHIVKADTPKIAEDTNPLQVYYLNFLAKEMTVEQSKDAYVKWQELMLSALPGYTKQLAGTQYPDLESWDFTSPDGATKFTLYRNGTGNACQVSITIVNKNINELMTILDREAPKAAAANQKPESIAAEGVRINGETFAQQLTQLIGHGRTSFKSIQGARDLKDKLNEKYATSFKMTGALNQEITRFPFLGIFYTAVFLDKTNDTRGKELFAQLRKLVAQSVPADFKDEGVKSTAQGDIATFSKDSEKLLVEVEKSAITRVVSVSVRKRDKY